MVRYVHEKNSVWGNNLADVSNVCSDEELFKYFEENHQPRTSTTTAADRRFVTDKTRYRNNLRTTSPGPAAAAPRTGGSSRIRPGTGKFMNW